MEPPPTPSSRLWTMLSERHKFRGTALSTIRNGVIQRQRPSMGDRGATKDVNGGTPPEAFELPVDLVQRPTPVVKDSDEGVPKGQWLPLDVSPSKPDDLDDATSAHVCAECGSKCNSRAQLANHKRNHNKVRCPVPWCDYVGKRKDQVRTHLRNRHQEMGFSIGRSATKRRSASSDADEGPKETKRVRTDSESVQEPVVEENKKPKDAPAEISSSASLTVPKVSDRSCVAAPQSTPSLPTWSHSAPISSAGPLYGYNNDFWRAYADPNRFYTHAGTSGGRAQSEAVHPRPEHLPHETDHDYATGDGRGGPGANYFSLL